MKPSEFIGTALIVLGILIFAHHDIAYTAREKVVNLGVILGGVVLLVMNSDKSLKQRQ